VIFVTVGSMFPFDRLIQVMDDWAKAHPEEEMLAQIGEGKYLPVNMKYVRSLSGKDFKATVQSAKLIVSHAGMGTIITSRQYGVPVVLLPRLASAGEHTTDHQLHTADRFRTTSGVFVADTDAQLPQQIIAAENRGTTGSVIEPYAPDAFIQKLKLYIFG
jgi:UDP-N-acetylglucosamine transferase subunit ALG13